MLREMSLRDIDEATRAQKVARVAIELARFGMERDALELAASSPHLPKSQQALLTTAIAIQLGRGLVNKAKSSLRRDPDGAITYIEEIENTQELRSFLPVSIADASDSRSALKRALNDLDTILPKVGKTDMVQPLCIQRCDVFSGTGQRERTTCLETCVSL